MNVKNLLKAAWFTPGPHGRWGLPLLFEGRPGTGKTANVRALAESVGLHLAVLISSLREPADFLGVPVPQPDGTLHYLPGRWATDLAKAQRGVLFLDEINTTAPATQAALLRVTQEGVVGDLELPAGVRICAAQNAVEEAAGGWDLAAPLANRFGHVAWEPPDAVVWGEWLLGSDDGTDDLPDAAAEEARISAAWPAPWARARGLISGFVKAKPDLLLKMPAAGSPAMSKAWPSPRTWELAARAMAGAEVHGLRATDAEELVAAFVGSGPAGELYTYRDAQDLPDPEEVLDGKVEFVHDAHRLDRTVAVLSSCAALVAPEKAVKRKDRAATMWKILGKVADKTPDLCVTPARVLIAARLGTSAVKESHGPLSKINPMLDAAGVRGGA